MDERLQSAPLARGIPEPTLRRIPKYRYYLAELQEKGVLTVSCSAIGGHFNLQPIQVRKDIQMTGIVGKPKVGYAVSELLAQIDKFLGLDNPNEAFLIGAGSLGTALLGYSRFSKYGMNVVAAFDTDPEKVGKWLHGRLVLPLEKLPHVARRMGVHLGIITVPAPVAQATADLLVRSGILALWNFAPVVLKVPGHVIVHNEDLYSSLAGLSCKLAKLMQARTHTDELITINKQPNNKQSKAEQLADEEDDVSITFDPSV
jgi:redox-sensing transcriptional repressor